MMCTAVLTARGEIIFAWCLSVWDTDARWGHGWEHKSSAVLEGSCGRDVLVLANMRRSQVPEGAVPSCLGRGGTDGSILGRGGAFPSRAWLRRGNRASSSACLLAENK